MTGRGVEFAKIDCVFARFAVFLSISARRTRIALTSAVVGLLIYLLNPITHIYLPIAYFTQETRIMDIASIQSVQKKNPDRFEHLDFTNVDTGIIDKIFPINEGRYGRLLLL